MGLHVCVVGAGITGLSAALNVQNLFQQVKVTIIADHFGVETTTPVTKEVFFPILSSVEGVDAGTLHDWLVYGWNHHFSKAKTPAGEESGHKLITGYYLWSGEEKKPLKCRATFNYHRMTREELDAEDFPYENGCRFTTVQVDMKVYLRWLMKEFRGRGGHVLYDTVHSLQSLYGKYDIVINCTGLRAREQVSDPTLVPIKGSMCRVKPNKQESPKNFLITDDGISIIPHGEDGLVDVGYKWEKGEHVRAKMKPVIKEVLERARGFCPFLEDCWVKDTWAEKRPYRREAPLVETELLKCGGAVLPLVHNIASSSTETLTLAWGTGVHVAHLVQDLSRTIKPFARIMMPFKTLI